MSVMHIIGWVVVVIGLLAIGYIAHSLVVETRAVLLIKRMQRNQQEAAEYIAYTKRETAAFNDFNVNMKKAAELLDAANAVYAPIPGKFIN